MQIRVPTGSCRTAVGAAIVALEAALKDFKARAHEQCYNSLYEGAVHNGLVVNDARKQEMRAMADRDVEHMLEGHPSNDTMRVLQNFVDMLAYHHGDSIV